MSKRNSDPDTNSSHIHLERVIAGSGPYGNSSSSDSSPWLRAHWRQGGRRRLHDPLRSVNRPSSLERLRVISEDTTASFCEDASSSHSRSPVVARRLACNRGAMITSDNNSDRSLPERRRTSVSSRLRIASYTIFRRQRVRRLHNIAEIQEPVNDIRSSTEAYPRAATSAVTPDKNRVRPKGEFTVPTRPPQ